MTTYVGVPGTFEQPTFPVATVPAGAVHEGGGWASRITGALNPGKEWLARQRDRLAYTVGAAAALGAGVEANTALDSVRENGVAQGAMELMAEPHLANAGGWSAVAALAVGAGIVMGNRLKRGRRRTGPDAGLGIMNPRGHERYPDRRNFAAAMRAGNETIAETRRFISNSPVAAG